MSRLPSFYTGLPPLTRLPSQADVDLPVLQSALRARVLGELEDSGFVVDDGLLVLPDAAGDPKQMARRLHSAHRTSVLAKNARFVQRWEDELLADFANGAEVIPERIRPVVVPVSTEREAALFRFASLRWSVPVSAGYGRRTRFLVFDDANGKLMGIFALGDPVFNLAVRDRLIGWDSQARQQRLYNVFDAYVLGAIEPYRQLIGGKLIAACAVADETASHLIAKYTGQVTVINGVEKDPRPVLVTTTSSLGRSSTYNRIRFQGRKLYASIGYTEGFGHFHFSDELFESLVEYLRLFGDVRGHQYGQGPNWKIRTLRSALEHLGLQGNLLRHGIRREVFIAPRALGWRSFLRGDSSHLHWLSLPVETLGAEWRERWGVPRSLRDPRYLEHRRDMMRISPEIEVSARAV